MKPSIPPFGVDRRALLSTLAVLPVLSAPLFSVSASAQTIPPGGALPSWNDGAPKFVRPEERIATFDQDGTLWVEHPNQKSA
jgi:hypothetical protein